jgi:predicted MFS family arabinose efflux permease
VAPVAGVMITHWGYAAAFAVTAACPLVAFPIVPRDEATFEQ